MKMTPTKFSPMQRCMRDRCWGVIVTVMLVWTQTVFSQHGDDEVLARVGTRTITVRELRDRMDLMPWHGKENPATRDSAKLQALASLVAEKLLAQQAIERGWEERPGTSSSLASIERLLARNELYRVEAAERVQIDSTEILTGLERYASLLQLEVFVMDSKERAERLASLLSAGKGTDAVSHPTEGILAHDTVAVGLGDLVPSYEEVVYGLGQIGETRAAFAERYGWAVFRLLGRETNPAYARQSISERLQVVQRLVRKRKEGLLAMEFARSLFVHPLKIDSAMFHVLADALRHVMLDDSAGHRQNDSYAVRGDDVDRLNVVLAPFRHTPFAAMGDLAVSVEEIVGELKFFPLRFSSLRRNAFLVALHQNLRMVVEAAIVSKEAMRRGLHQRSDVRRELTMWIDAMQAEKFLKYLIDSLAHREDSAGDTTVAAAQQAMRKAVGTINTYLAQLATSSGVTFDLARLRRVTVTPSSMVTRRLIGFGGSMMATPMIMHLWEWLDVWIESERISP